MSRLTVIFRTARHEQVRQLKPSSCLANGASGNMQQAACSHMESDYPHEPCVFCGGIEDISLCIGCTVLVCRECSVKRKTCTSSLTRLKWSKAMNCYVCLVETGYATRSAFAVCQCCGAGACDIHLVAYAVGPVIGMGGGTTGVQRRRILCVHCADSSLPATSPGRFPKQQGEGRRKRWWKWFERKRQERLPDAQEAIADVERFLKQGRSD